MFSWFQYIFLQYDFTKFVSHLRRGDLTISNGSLFEFEFEKFESHIEEIFLYKNLKNSPSRFSYFNNQI